jgi:hypothetical protein
MNAETTGGTWHYTPSGSSNPNIYDLSLTNVSSNLNQRFQELGWFGYYMSVYDDNPVDFQIYVGQNLGGTMFDAYCTSISNGQCVNGDGVSNGVQQFDLADILVLPIDVPNSITRGSVIMHAIAEMAESVTGSYIFEHAHNLGILWENDYYQINKGYSTFRLYQDTEWLCNSVGCVAAYPWSNGGAVIIQMLGDYEVTNIIPGTADFGVEYDNSGLDIVVADVYFDPDYSISNVPVPSAVWLFGSGLFGLIGVARRTI